MPSYDSLPFPLSSSSLSIRLSCSSVRLPSTHLFTPPFFLSFPYFPSICVIPRLDALLDGVFCSPARGSRFCHCDDCGSSALVAAAARRPLDVGSEGRALLMELV